VRTTKPWQLKFIQEYAFVQSEATLVKERKKNSEQISIARSSLIVLLHYDVKTNLLLKRLARTMVARGDTACLN